jgi:hypothetical protein
MVCHQNFKNKKSGVEKVGDMWGRRCGYAHKINWQKVYNIE